MMADSLLNEWSDCIEDFDYFYSGMQSEYTKSEAIESRYNAGNGQEQIWFGEKNNKHFNWDGVFICASES